MVITSLNYIGMKNFKEILKIIQEVLKKWLSFLKTILAYLPSYSLVSLWVTK